MGLILDSSVLIASERKGDDVRALLERLAGSFPGQVIGLSVISLAELTHGAMRANSEALKSTRLQFIRELSQALPVYPVLIETAILTGTIEAEAATKGVRIAFADLLIGSTALSLGFGVVTHNLRHFRQIPDLQVISL